MNFTSSMSSSSAAACLPGAGLSTHRITKNPIISMTRSAKVKIHSGHSSHSVGLHLQAAFLAIVIAEEEGIHRGDAENAVKGDSFLELVNAASDAVVEDSYIEVDEEPDGPRAQAKIGKQ